MNEDYKKTIAEMEKCMADIDNMVSVRLEQADSIRDDISEYDEGVIEIRKLANKLDEINNPKKKWWQFFKKETPKPLVSAIYEMTYGDNQPAAPTEIELAEKQAYLDGFSEGRHDGDAMKAYRLWRKMKEHT